MKRPRLEMTLACITLAFVAGNLGAQPSADAAAKTLGSGLALHEPQEDRAPADLDVYASYQEAQRLEAEIVQIYREIRAAELSMVQRQTLDRSLKSTLPPLSERAEVDGELLGKRAADAAAVKAYQEELAVVMQETDAIVAHARDLLESFLVEPQSATPRSESEAAPESLTPQEIAARATQPPPADRSLTEEEKAQREAELERLEAQIEKAVADAETKLAEALKEIQAAKETVRKETEKLEKSEEPKEAEPTPAEAEKLAELKAVETKIHAAEEAVEKVMETLKAMSEAPEHEVEKAEQAVKEMREALASVTAADQAVPKKEQAATKAHTEEAVSQMKAATESMESAAQAIAAMARMRKGGGGGQSDNPAIARRQALGALAHARSGTWLDLTDQMRGEKLDADPKAPPQGERPSLWASMDELENAPTARKVLASEGGDGGGKWFFIGDWYVLSRYNNPGRVNIQTVYPPESIVDLNARYVSEDGKPMQWEYASYLPPAVTPHGWESWKIYYFHTELYFEEETEVWLAIGSDDRSDIWINDLPVWHSSNQHKGWHPAEGFRKVVFRAGHNTVLVRLENGHGGTDFSLYMNLGEER